MRERPGEGDRQRVGETTSERENDRKKACVTGVMSESQRDNECERDHKCKRETTSDRDNE